MKFSDTIAKPARSMASPGSQLYANPGARHAVRRHRCRRAGIRHWGRRCEVDGMTIGNRFAVQPMEGWDGEHRRPALREHQRRWRHFGLSGAKLIWGGEAVAVRPDGRANPNQLAMTADSRATSGAARHWSPRIARRRATPMGMSIGLQLTHSGRFCKPNEQYALRAAHRLYRHPISTASSVAGRPPADRDDEING